MQVSHGRCVGCTAVGTLRHATWLLTPTMLRLRPLARQLRTVSCAPNSARWARLASTAASLSYLRSVSEEDVAHFSTLLPKSAVLSTFGPSSVDAAELDAYNKDWMDKYHGQSRVVLRPKTVEQVSEIMKYCNERGIGVVPQGGNTGLVGGSVPINDEVVINLGGMSKIRSFDSVTGTHLSTCFVSRVFDAVRGGILVADAGCVLETLIEHIGKEDHIMPLDLGAKGRSVVLIWSPRHKLKLLQLPDWRQHRYQCRRSTIAAIRLAARFCPWSRSRTS
jgi:hypothetical protein